MNRFSIHFNGVLTKRLFTMSSVTAEDVAHNLNSIKENIEKVYAQSPKAARHSSLPTLVAVSKTKPIDLIVAAYSAGQRYFGENYIQEMVDKSNSDEIVSKCPDIKWHFIGAIQSNKILKLLATRNLFAIETIQSIKHADLINNGLERRRKRSGSGSPTEDMDKLSLNASSPINPIEVFVQVNTSGEEQKNGLSPSEAVECALHIRDKCPKLRFAGFMTIGSLGASVQSSVRDENADFECLVGTREKYCNIAKIDDPKSIWLSMGMSADYELAIKMGSTHVRLGSAIFGARERKL